MTLLLLQFGALSVLTIIFIQILIKFPMSKAFPTNRGMHAYLEMPSSGGLGILASYICIPFLPIFTMDIHLNLFTNICTHPNCNTWIYR